MSGPHTKNEGVIEPDCRSAGEWSSLLVRGVSVAALGLVVWLVGTYGPLSALGSSSPLRSFPVLHSSAYLGPPPAIPGILEDRRPQDDSLRFDPERLLADLSILAHDSMEGRRTGTEGGARARRFLERAFDDRNLLRVPDTMGAAADARTRSFPVNGDATRVMGTNVLGRLVGSEFPSRYIVVSAHYDHLGVRGGEVFNGADDNASGVAALLALAQAFERVSPRHSILFVALDAEESGLVGARAFVSDPPIPIDSILLNVNLDMVGRSEANEIYVAGTYHYPALVPLVEAVASESEIHVLMGHDHPDLPSGDDWTMASDHGAFHEAGVPFAYFGVEDHPGYHRPTDTVDRITPDFYVEAVVAILDFVRRADLRGGPFH